MRHERLFAVAAMALLLVAVWTTAVRRVGGSATEITTHRVTAAPSGRTITAPLVQSPLSGVGAGDGLLVVPAGNLLVAYAGTSGTMGSAVRAR